MSSSVSGKVCIYCGERVMLCRRADGVVLLVGTHTGTVHCKKAPVKGGVRRQ